MKMNNRFNYEDINSVPGMVLKMNMPEIMTTQLEKGILRNTGSES
jgi:hypothetical protein